MDDSLIIFFHDRKGEIKVWKRKKDVVLFPFVSF